MAQRLYRNNLLLLYDLQTRREQWFKKHAKFFYMGNGNITYKNYRQRKNKKNNQGTIINYK